MHNRSSTPGNTQMSNRTFPFHQSPPRVGWFISRGNGIYVPLIPVDELPSNVRLAGVPLTLDFHQTVGMHHVAVSPSTGTRYQLETDLPVRQSSASNLSEVLP